MQSGEGTLALDVSTVRARMDDVERHLEQRLAIVVFARKPSSEADALAGYLRPLHTLRDDRSDWQAMRDAWRLRHVSTCFSLAGRSGYAWRIEESDALVSVTFTPAQRCS